MDIISSLQIIITRISDGDSLKIKVTQKVLASFNSIMCMIFVTHGECLCDLCERGGCMDVEIGFHFT